MDDLHELREMITICADELQEAAGKTKKMTDALIAKARHGRVCRDHQISDTPVHLTRTHHYNMELMACQILKN